MDNLNTQEQEQGNSTEDIKNNIETQPESFIFETVFNSKFTESNGVFTDEDYNLFSEKGYSKELVDTIIKGKKSSEVEAFNNVIKDFGTAEDYAAAVVYAQNTWSKNDIETFNATIANSDEKLTKLLVGSLMKDYKSSLKVDRKDNLDFLQYTKNPAPVAETGYKDKSEMRKDLNNPNYKKDPLFREKVELKIQATNWL